jgi:EmrB/QacA subfamily drug resistance transporter
MASTTPSHLSDRHDLTDDAMSGHWNARLWGALFVVCGALFLDGLDISMVGVALPSIRTSLNLSTSQLQWIVSGYVLGYGGLLLLGGRAADLLGRRRVFLIAVSVFAVASLAGGLVNSASLLITFRLVKGAAAAFTAPSGLSILTTTFPEGPVRNRALSVYTACGASGFSAGLILGGLMTELGWRWTFLAPAPVAVAVAFFGYKLLPGDGPRESLKGRFDIAGAVSVSAGMLLLVRTIVRAPQAGWGSVQTVGLLALSVAIIATFVVIERRSAHPLVRLGILRSGSLVRANLGALAMTGCYFAFQFVVTLFLQSGLGWSAVHMSLAFLPAGLIVAVGSTRMGALAGKYGTERLVAVGFVSFIVAYALFFRVGANPSYVTDILPSMILLGTGFAFSFASLSIQATTGVADEEQGLASGLVQTALQIGGALVLAVVSAVISSHAGNRTDTASLLGALHPVLDVVMGVAGFGLVVAIIGVIRGGAGEAVGEIVTYDLSENEAEAEVPQAAFAITE